MDRDYIGVSIKHSKFKWKPGMPCLLWGYHRTEDDEKRCFGGYTFSLQDCERYAIGEFDKVYPPDVVKYEPVKMTIDLCKRWKDYDTVLVLASEYASYLDLCGLDFEGNPILL